MGTGGIPLSGGIQGLWLKLLKLKEEREGEILGFPPLFFTLPQGK